MGAGDSATTSLQIWGAGGHLQGQDAEGCGSGGEEASKEEQRCPLSQMLHWVLRTQR